MRQLTDSEWEQVSVLYERLRGMSATARAAELAQLRTQGDSASTILRLVSARLARPPEPDRDRTGERVGSCTLSEPIGTGGMGVVYRAWQDVGPTGRREVAVKLLHPTLVMEMHAEAEARFRQEIEMLVKLEHAGIVRLYDGGLYTAPDTGETIPFLAMELVRDGQPLITYTDQHELTMLERLTLFQQVCEAVGYAHSYHRIVHRDLKPTNMAPV